MVPIIPNISAWKRNTEIVFIQHLFRHTATPTGKVAPDKYNSVIHHYKRDLSHTYNYIPDSVDIYCKL